MTPSEAAIVLSLIAAGMGVVLGFATGHRVASGSKRWSEKYWADEYVSCQQRCDGCLTGARRFVPAWGWERWYCNNVDFVKGRCEKYV